MIRFFIICVMMLPSVLHAHGDTTFFNKYFVVTTRDKAHFFRPKPIREKDSKLYHVIDYYMNGNLQMDGFTRRIKDVELIFDGYTKYYNEGGFLTEEGNLVANRKVGKWKCYRDSTDILWYVAEYQDNKLNGELISYYEDGKIKRKETYANDKSIGGKCFDAEGKVVAHSPFFDNHEWFDRFYEVLNQCVNYPEVCRYDRIYGKVLVEFWIDEKGTVEPPLLVKPVHPALDAEAMRCVNIALKKCAPIGPVLVDGISKRDNYIIPIAFRIK